MDFLFKEEITERSISDFPQTRYQGSKHKLLPWIWGKISFLDFDRTADVFGGTAAVSYLFKTQGKSVVYNDILKSNYLTGLALIENGQITVSQADIDNILNKKENHELNIISTNFKNIYFTDEENQWLDRIIQNIYFSYGDNKYKKAMLLWALFQACIIKRPFNLFHRKNLYLRTTNVKRTFGNKTTWDKSFSHYFVKFIQQINNAIFDNGQACKAYQKDAIELDNEYDLVYIDTPYISLKGVGVDYYHFYHFLEGISDYFNWENQIDFSRKHHPLIARKNRWTDRLKITSAFKELIDHFHYSHIVISYRSDGIPSVEEILKILRLFKKNTRVEVFNNYKYVLSTNSNTHEVLLIGWD